jgi:hypothetical protein
MKNIHAGIYSTLNFGVQKRQTGTYGTCNAAKHKNN